MKITQNLLAAILISLLSINDGYGDELDFNRDIQPILSDKCYFCHGPDQDNRQADLRLDTEEGAQDAIESGYFLERIFSDDPDEIMPPPEAKHDLTNEQREKLKSWIESGAIYEKHWAFEELPNRVEVPTNPTDSWCRNDIDRFVLRKLERNQLVPTPEAAPLRWLRRVTFDLTGLPPTLSEIANFEKKLATSDDREAIYLSNVERLLNSNKFGEHMAVAWLDAARYADSYGYQADSLNTQWPYRDWVIRAFNDNLPYDQFITWQLAGDLLENPTRDQKLATAFNRIHRLNNEGGAVFEEWRIENVADRVHTFGTAMLGLTLECCRCHDHKYDPIPMRDFYAMSAFFNSIDENGVYDTANKVPVPSLLLPNSEQSAAYESAKRELERLKAEYKVEVEHAKNRFNDWDSSTLELKTFPDHIRSLCFDGPNWIQAQKKIYYSGTADAYFAKPLETVIVDDSRFPQLPNQLADDWSFPEAKVPEKTTRKSIMLDGERGIVIPGIETFDRWTPFTVTLTVKETKRHQSPSVVIQSSFGQLTYNGWDLIAEDGFLELRMYRVWPGNMIAARSASQLPINQWNQISVYYDGSSSSRGLKFYLDG
ncbi:MAG: DUF1549 domain-containing protein [Planctomycetota bacterium]